MNIATTANAQDRSELIEAATKLVSSALIAPALSTLHQSHLRPARGPFAAGAAEKRFAPLLEQHLADRIAKAANFPLVRTIVDRFESASKGAPG